MNPPGARRPAGPLRWAQRLCIWPILLVACGLRLAGLGAESLWYDEAYSATLARAEWGAAWQMMAADLNPPLHSLVLRAGVALFGSSEFAVRFVSVCWGVLLVPLMWALARRLFDGTSARVAALLASLAPLLVWYAREARAYGQATTLGLAAAYALVRALSESRDRQSRWWAAFAAFALAAVYSHYLTLYLIAALGVYWLTQIKAQSLTERSRGALAFGVAAAGTAASLPRILDLALSSRIYWPGRLDVLSALTGMARAMVVWRVEAPALADALVILCVSLALVGVLHALASSATRRGVLLACLVVLVGTALMLAASFRRPKFEPRYVITLAPFVWLLVAAGPGALLATSRARPRAGRVAAGLTVLALAGGLATSSLGVAAGAWPRDDWRGAVAYLRQKQQVDEITVLASGHAFPALAYYGAPAWVAWPDDPVLDVTHVLDYGYVAPALNRIQRDSRGVWLLQWQAEVVDPTDLVPTLLGDLGTEQPVEAEFAGLRLRHFVLDQPAPLPPEPLMTRRLDRSPLTGLTALGLTLEPQPLPADQPLAVRMVWRADAEVRGAAGGSLRILDGQGNEWARRDELLGGLFYSERWPLNEWVMRQYTVSLPSGAPPGAYRLKQIVYRGAETGELDLGTFAVTRPVRGPDLAALGIAPEGLARWGELSLLAAGSDQDTAKPCEALNFTAVWRAEARPSVDYHLRVMFAGQSSEQPLAPDWPTSQWRPGDVWRTRHHVAVPCRALDGIQELRLALVDASGQLIAAPLEAARVKIQSGRVFALPAIQHSVTAELGGQVRLLGYDYKFQMSNAKSQVDLTLYWQAMREVTSSLTVMTHIEGDRLWGQHDGLPAQGLKPTDRWAVNEIVADRHVITLDPATPPGQYRLLVGMYDSVSLARAPAFDAGGRRWPEDAIVLQDVVVNK